MRTFDKDLVRRRVYDYKGELEGFTVENWLADAKNIALTNYNDLALFQYDGKGIYIGHYFFVSRGRSALTAGRDFLDEVFSIPGVEVVKGYTPVTNLGARWISRQLGFKSGGVIETDDDIVEIFIKTRLQHKE